MLIVPGSDRRGIRTRCCRSCQSSVIYVMGLAASKVRLTISTNLTLLTLCKSYYPDHFVRAYELLLLTICCLPHVVLHATACRCLFCLAREQLSLSCSLDQ